MPDHISTTFLIIGLVLGFGFRFVALSFFLWVMIQIQKFQYELLPVIGAAFVAAGLDMVPFVGHYIAVAVLYICIWKITRASLFPEAVFTVALSYALMYMVTLILLAYAPVPRLHTASGPDYNFDDQTNAAAIADVQTTNQVQVAQAPPAPSVPQDKAAADISVKGVSRGVNDSMVTIQCGKKDYVISLGEGTTISTKDGPASVRFVKADENNVTLSVRGQEVKYALQ
jgi:hypothetical protein